MKKLLLVLVAALIMTFPVFGQGGITGKVTPSWTGAEMSRLLIIMQDKTGIVATSRPNQFGYYYLCCSTQSQNGNITLSGIYNRRPIVISPEHVKVFDGVIRQLDLFAVCFVCE